MLRLRAHAKINLSLKILGKRPDGYHDLESVMQSVSLADIITLEPIPAGIELATSNLRLPVDRRNLAWQAAELFFQAQSSKLKTQNYGIKIYIEKNIPLAAGLAGGSADAAAVLYGLNQLAKEGGRRTKDELMSLGAQIGSDVPFCLVGGRCLVKGRGEKVERREWNVERRNYVLVVPEVEVPTKWAYQAWDEMTNDKLQMTNEGKNYLEPPVIQKYPIIKSIKERLVELGCSAAQMSGSGPSVFGAVSGPELGEKIVAEMKRDFPRAYLVHSVDRGIEEI